MMIFGDLKDQIEIRFGKPKTIEIQPKWPCGAPKRRTTTINFTAEHLNEAMYEIISGAKEM